MTNKQRLFSQLLVSTSSIIFSNVYANLYGEQMKVPEAHKYDHVDYTTIDFCIQEPLELLILWNQIIHVILPGFAQKKCD